MAGEDDVVALEFDLDALTIGDVEDLENLSGIALSNMDFGHPSMKLLRAMVYVVERRQHPDFTFEDARSVRLSRLRVAEPPGTGAAEPDPTPPASASGAG